MPEITKRNIGSRFGASESKWKLGVVVKNMDWFGREGPSFNLKGERKFTTLFGGIISLLIMLLVLGYAILKGVHLFQRVNPSINTYPIPSYFDISHTVNLN